MIASTVMITDVFMPYFPGIEESGVLLVQSRPCIEITPLSSFQEGLGLPTYVATMLVACVATRRPRARSTLGATLAGCSELLSLKGSGESEYRLVAEACLSIRRLAPRAELPLL
jgi:hypothetical protein